MHMGKKKGAAQAGRSGEGLVPVRSGFRRHLTGHQIHYGQGAHEHRRYDARRCRSVRGHDVRQHDRPCRMDGLPVRVLAGMLPRHGGHERRLLRRHAAAAGHRVPVLRARGGDALRDRLADRHDVPRHPAHLQRLRLLPQTVRTSRLPVPELRREASRPVPRALRHPPPHLPMRSEAAVQRARPPQATPQAHRPVPVLPRRRP